MTPSYRKPVGVLAVIAGLVVYSGTVARLVAPLGGLPWFVQVPAYLLLGTVWIAPLKPLLRWMESGVWRVR